MVDDDVQAQVRVIANDRYHKVAKFPIKNIRTPTVLVYVGSDSLVDIRVMLKELLHHTRAKENSHFEHLDFLWAEEVDKLVFPLLFQALTAHAGRDHSKTIQRPYKALENGELAISADPDYPEDGKPSYACFLANGSVGNTDGNEPSVLAHKYSPKTTMKKSSSNIWSSPNTDHPPRQVKV